MGKKISVANLVATAGGIVCVLFSFFGFYDFGGDSRSAWSTDIGAFVTTIPAILAIVLVAWSLCELFGVKLPADVLTFSSNQLKATWGISALGIMIAHLTPDFPWDKGIGFWFMLIGSAAMAAGSVMALLGKGTDLISLGGGTKPAAAPMPPQPYGMAPPPPPPGMVPPPPPPPPAG